MSILLGNSGSPRWYTGPDRGFDEYLARLVEWGATSAEIVLHHGPFDERTARVHVIDPEWTSTVAAYHQYGLDVQLHVSLDQRFATSRWHDDRNGLKREFEPILALTFVVAQNQQHIALVLHGAANPTLAAAENEDATVGLLDWLACEIESQSLPVSAALELGAAKPARESAAARSRSSVERIVRRISSNHVGICWDLAHDCENASSELGWQLIPSEEFLRNVVHVHLHDLDDQGTAHYPLLLGNVPFEQQLAALAKVRSLPSLTMEVRWICATRLGEPWEMLGRSYDVVEKALGQVNSQIG